MKAQNVLLLVLAGALGGAGLMKLVERPQPAPKVAAVSPPVAPAPAAVPIPVPAPPAAVEPPVTEPVSPPPARVVHQPVRRERPRRVETATIKPSPMPPAPERQTAQVETPPLPAQPAPVQQPADPPAATAPAREEAPTVAPAPPPPPSVTLSAGTLIPVRLVDGLSSERNASGDTFQATLERELVADGFVIAERGARVDGRVVNSSRGTKTGGRATLDIELTRLYTSDGQQVAIHTESFQKRMDPNRRQDAEKIAAGAVIGAAIGAIAGGGKGAAIGAGVGGGAGTGDVLLTRKPATLPSETSLSFRLSAPVTLTERR